MVIYKINVRYLITRHKLACCNFVACFVLITFVIGKPYLYQRSINTFSNDKQTVTAIEHTAVDMIKKTNLPMNYILLWTHPRKYPFRYFGEGNSLFVNKTCEWTNCYVTGNKNLLGAYTEFEVIAFNGPQLSLSLYVDDIPKVRGYHQKYVFANIESAANYPFRSDKLDGFFNWTWTYKLNSDGFWGYITVKDSNGTVIGPSEHMRWLRVDNMDPIDQDFRDRLNSKSKAVAWLNSNCVTNSRREEYVKAFQFYLNGYNLKVDMYGECGDHQCPTNIMSHCLRMIKKHYYFYLAFENSIAEDYVTEKLLHALNYDTVPIVYGGANYSRFMPDGIYLDAVKLSPSKLAQTVFMLINNPLKYYNFFRWKKYYSFHATHESPESDSYCKFCAMVNNKTLMNNHKSYKHFNAWWMHNVKRVI